MKAFTLLGLAATMMMAGCTAQGGSTAAGGRSAENMDPTTLKGALGQYFLIGTSVNDRQAFGLDARGDSLIARHFNCVVAENSMKHEVVHPREGVYDFDKGDALVKFAEDNGLKLTGHCLVWHSQCAPWLFVDDEGKTVDAETLKERMREHITTVLQHYKGKMVGWDVVNEAIMENGSYRRSKFYEILGEEFIPLAFQYAHEADPDVELYLNDYNMHHAGKRDTYVRIVKDLQARGLRIDAVGMQGHMGLDYPTVEDFEATIEALAGAGVKVMVTEWDMSALPTLHQSANVGDVFRPRRRRGEPLPPELNPYTEALPDSVSEAWNARMGEFMDLFIKHADVITRVTAWGSHDAISWKNGFPIPGRTDYPLLFGRDYQAKPFLKKYGVK